MASTSNRRHARSSLLAGLFVVAVGSACVQEQDYLIVERTVWFDDPEDCTMDAQGDIPLAMTVDVAYPTRIGMGFVVTNNQSPNPNSNSGIDDSQIEVESVRVNLSFSGGALENSSYELTVPNNAIAGGDSLPFLVTVPTETVDSIREAMIGSGQTETLDMEVVFVGRKYGASGGKKLGEVTTRAYTYPFDLCLNCIEDCNEDCGCPSPPDYWAGVCGFAQGIVTPPECDAATEGETGGP